MFSSSKYWLPAAAVYGLAISSSARPETLLLGEQQGYTSGIYTAFAQPWGAGTLRPGVDFADTIAIDKRSFPAKSVIRWRWPPVPPKAAGVYAYDAIDFGDYWNTVPQRPIKPRRLAAIRTLAVTFDLAFASAGNANVLLEFFATSKAGGNSSHIAEIGFFLHTPPPTARFMASSRRIGTFTDGARRNWTVTKNDQYIMFAPADRRDILSATIDMKRGVDFLIANGILTGHEWFNGGAIGVEPITGSGALTLRALSFAS